MSESLSTTEPENSEGEIEAGFVEELSDLSVEPRRHRERTASVLAWWLMSILAGTGVLHYATVLYLATHGQTAALEHVDKFFGAWLPVISGLSGSVVTYYFTRDRS